MHRSWKNTVGEAQNLQILEDIWRIMGQVQLSMEESPLLLVFIQSRAVISVPKLKHTFFLVDKILQDSWAILRVWVYQELGILSNLDQ